MPFTPGCLHVLESRPRSRLAELAGPTPVADVRSGALLTPRAVLGRQLLVGLLAIVIEVGLQRALGALFWPGCSTTWTRPRLRWR